MKNRTGITTLVLTTIALVAAAFFSTSQATTPKGWSTDLDQALKDAKRQNKSVLVEFTGSTWCPPCIVMHKEVFSKEEFVAEASKDFILVELDFPADYSMVESKHHSSLLKYKPEGFPTIILLDPNGKEFTRFFANDYPSTEKFLAHLEGSLEKRGLD